MNRSRSLVLWAKFSLHVFFFPLAEEARYVLGSIVSKVTSNHWTWINAWRKTISLQYLKHVRLLQTNRRHLNFWWPSRSARRNGATQRSAPFGLRRVAARRRAAMAHRKSCTMLPHCSLKSHINQETFRRHSLWSKRRKNAPDIWQCRIILIAFRVLTWKSLDFLDFGFSLIFPLSTVK